MPANWPALLTLMFLAGALTGWSARALWSLLRTRRQSKLRPGPHGYETRVFW